MFSSHPDTNVPFLFLLRAEQDRLKWEAEEKRKIREWEIMKRKSNSTTSNPPLPKSCRLDPPSPYDIKFNSDVWQAAQFERGWNSSDGGSSVVTFYLFAAYDDDRGKKGGKKKRSVVRLLALVDTMNPAKVCYIFYNQF